MRLRPLRMSDGPFILRGLNDWAGISMHHIISHLNGWQAVAYAMVVGIFTALAAVILDQILSFFYYD